MSEDQGMFKIYQLLGRLEGKLDAISGMHVDASKRMDVLERNNRELSKEISTIRQVQARHAVIVGVASTVFSAVIVHIIRGG